MIRRAMTLVVVASLAVLGAPSPAIAVSPGPVLNQNFPDPDIVKVGNTYYAFATNADGRHIKWATSTNLVNWTVRASDALPTLGAWVNPDWQFPGGGIWAPEVFSTGNGYTMYYTAHDRASDRQCIGAARSTNPGGPYTPASRALVCTPGIGGSIDPSSYVENGQRYILWKNDGNCCGQVTWLRIQPVSSDGMTVTGAETLLIRQDRPFEGALVEAPTLWKRDGVYTLFYSANFFGNASYVTGYARSTNLLGPYTKSPAPLLSTDAFAGTVRGPGGQDIVVGPDGRERIAFHGWNTGFQYRAMYMHDLGWANGNPVVRGAKLRYQAENAAIVRAVIRDASGASDGRAVGYIDFPDSRVTVTVYAARAGEHRLYTRFGNGSGAPATHRLWVNGADVGTVNYPNTGWDNWQTVERAVQLNEGWNTIAYGKGSLYAELDAIDVA
jgi:beta-xylosidase